jgi:type-F conjugative transfer system pilin assembly protein TrbC
VFTLNASGAERFEFKQEDIDFASDLANRSRQVAMKSIKAKWKELQIMQAKSAANQSAFDSEDLDDLIPLNEPNYTLRIFVSSSMGDSLLKHYVEQAKKYKAVLVFNGLPDNSFLKLTELVYQITGGTGEATSIQLDNISFKRYGITSVPSFVLNTEEDVFNQSKPLKFDKISGNIGIRRALETIEEQGELSDIAGLILDEARH